MNWQHVQQLVEKAVNNEDPLAVTLTVQEVWVLISAIEYSYTNSDWEAVAKGVLDKASKRLQEGVSAVYADAPEYFQEEWHKHGVPRRIF